MPALRLWTLPHRHRKVQERRSAVARQSFSSTGIGRRFCAETTDTRTASSSLAFTQSLPRASCGGAGGGIDVNEVYRTTERSGTAQISPAETGGVHGPKRSANRRVWPVALHRRIDADSAARTNGNSRPETQFAGAARTSGACQRNIQKRPNNRSEEPEIQQKRPEHPKTLKHAQGMFGIEADKHGSQHNHQEPSDAVSNLQLQLEVLSDTHVPDRTRVDTYPLPVTSRRRHILATCRHLVTAV